MARLTADELDWLAEVLRRPATMYLDHYGIDPRSPLDWQVTADVAYLWEYRVPGWVKWLVRHFAPEYEPAVKVFRKQMYYAREALRWYRIADQAERLVKGQDDVSTVA